MPGDLEYRCFQVNIIIRHQTVQMINDLFIIVCEADLYILMLFIR